MAFYNREDELLALESRWKRAQAEFFVVWGRRRVGKTELLSKFLEGKRGFLFEATEGVQADHLHDLSKSLASATGSRLLEADPLSYWAGALEAIADFAREMPAVVVLDEFQCFPCGTPHILSLFNRCWIT